MGCGVSNRGIHRCLTLVIALIISDQRCYTGNAWWDWGSGTRVVAQLSGHISLCRALALLLLRCFISTSFLALRYFSVCGCLGMFSNAAFFYSDSFAALSFCLTAIVSIPLSILQWPCPYRYLYRCCDGDCHNRVSRHHPITSLVDFLYKSRCGRTEPFR